MRAPRWFVRCVWVGAGSWASLCFAALVLACGGSSLEPSRASRPEVVPVVRNDYARALRLARDRGALLLVDAWAPWCPPCRLFHEEVLHDPRLPRFQPYYVFATVDTDQPSSTAFNERYEQRVWPTLLVIDPASQEVVARMEGAPTFPLFARFLSRALLNR